MSKEEFIESCQECNVNPIAEHCEHGLYLCVGCAHDHWKQGYATHPIEICDLKVAAA